MMASRTDNRGCEFVWIDPRQRTRPRLKVRDGLLAVRVIDSVMDSFVQSGVDCVLQEPVADDEVRCGACNRRCVVAEGKAGWCRTRTVRGGRLWAATYGRVAALSANPIEKKPFHHFYPGSYALTAASWGCNFACTWCQNWRLSKAISGQDRFVRPEAFVEQTIQSGCQGTSISFNEPTLSLEWALDVFRAVRQRGRGLYNTFVTNGYMTVQALELLAQAGLDALNVDVKGGAAVYRQYCQAEAGPVWRTCAHARSLGLHLEVTTLVIPGVNDDSRALRRIASRINRELGSSVPWHVNAYSAAYRFRAGPTPLATLTRARRSGQEAGLRFVYAGNVAGTGSNTYCPQCGVLLAERSALTLVRCDITAAGACPSCGEVIPGVGWDWRESST